MRKEDDKRTKGEREKENKHKKEKERKRIKVCQRIKKRSIVSEPSLLSSTLGYRFETISYEKQRIV